MKPPGPFQIVLLFILPVVFCWSGWNPYDRFTWWLEVAPGLIGILGSQGDVWDTQADMAWALAAAICALLLLSRSHDRALQGMAPAQKGSAG